MNWEVALTPEYQAWFNGLSREHQLAIAVDLEVLRSQGPQLGRPYVDHVKGSRHDNMKELRTSSGTGVYRSFFAFDPRRRGIGLVGGDKAGQNQDRFYKTMTKQADALYDRHLEQLNVRKGKT